MTTPMAERINRLGTETAFAVSAEAREWAAKGNRVYPFHLGDVNMKTPEVVMAAAIKAMKEGKTGYCPNAGIPELRETLAEDIGKARGMEFGIDNVSIQPGGKPAIGKFLLITMDPGDKVLYPNPGFPIYESLINFHGGQAVPYGFTEAGDHFELDMAAIRKGIDGGAKLLIYNNYQNPTGASSPRAEMEELARLCVENDLFVLSDEAYFDVRFGGEPLSIAAMPGMKDRTVILYTFSKKYAMTGWRLGAAIGPEDFIAKASQINVNDESCSNHFIQYGALAGLKGDDSEPDKILATLKERRDVLVDMLSEIPGINCYRPETTFYLFPNVTEVMQRKGLTTPDEFRTACLHETGVSFCTRNHFGAPLPGETQQYVRFAYSGIDVPDIKEGIGKLAEFLG